MSNKTIPGMNSVVLPVVTSTLNKNENDKQNFVSIHTHLTDIFGINLSAMVSEVWCLK